MEDFVIVPDFEVVCVGVNMLEMHLEGGIWEIFADVGFAGQDVEELAEGVWFVKLVKRLASWSM